MSLVRLAGNSKYLIGFALCLWFPWIQADRIYFFVALYGFLYFSLIFSDFLRFSWLSEHGCLKHGTSLKSRPAAPVETFAPFQAGFLSSEGFHNIFL